MNRRALSFVAALAMAGSALAACSSDSTEAQGPSASGSTSTGATLPVVVSFYPLEYIVQRVGGDKVSVTNLTKPGVEPHDLELTPQDIAAVGAAKVAIYSKGIQPAVDEAIAGQNAAAAFDVSAVADLDLVPSTEIGGEPTMLPSATASSAAGDGQPQERTASAIEGATQGDTHDAHGEADHAHGAVDPHFWLDPIRYQKVTEAVTKKLGDADPAHKMAYAQNAESFIKELTTLDGDFSSGLSSCASKDLVTSHAAFGYLAQRYGFRQISIAGISPEVEPDPTRMAKIGDYIRAHKVGTIYTETLVSPAIGETIAKETGATTAVLDPIEGITSSSAGTTYLEVMRANLATLQKGQRCS